MYVYVCVCVSLSCVIFGLTLQEAKVVVLIVSVEVNSSPQGFLFLIYSDGCAKLSQPYKTK